MPAQSKPISTVSGAVFRVPVSLFGDLCLGHCEGQLSRFPLGGAWPAREPRQQEVVPPCLGQDGDLISGGFAIDGEPPWAHGGSGLF